MVTKTRTQEHRAAPTSNAPGPGAPAPISDALTTPLDGPLTRGNRIRMLVGAMICSSIAAFVCNAILELLQSGGDFHHFFTQSVGQAKLGFLISSGLVWLVLLGGIALLGRLWVTVGAFTAAAVLVGFISYEKTSLRQEPLYPSDLAFAGHVGFLKDMVHPGPLAAVISIVLLVLLIGVLCGRLAARVYPPVRRRKEPRRWWALVGARCAVLVAVAVTVAYAGRFNTPGNVIRAAYEGAGVAWAPWFQKENYVKNGFLPGFLYNLPGPAMSEPEGYSRETMIELAREYSELARSLNQGRAAQSLSDVNIVLVLSEAFTDPTTVRGPRYSEDPIPFTRSLMERTRSGTMLAQLFGGGTANMEFETLTGMSLSQFLPQLNTPYQQLVDNTPTFPSAVGYFRRMGHRAVGVHPYTTSMYKRYAVYPTLGFHSFVDESRLQRTERIGEDAYVSDAAAFHEVLHQIEESTEPSLVNLVTMQNHYPMADTYEDPVPVEGVSDDVGAQLSHYLRGLRLTDRALQEFIRALRGSDEKTAVVMYGDHAPAFWSGQAYDDNGADAFRRTPYFMWTNFQRLPEAGNAITSPIYFLPTLLDDLGATLPPYYALLLELQTEIAAMEQGEYFLPDGRKVSESELGARGRRLLDDYRLVQYDLAVGGRFSQSAMFYPED